MSDVLDMLGRARSKLERLQRVVSPAPPSDFVGEVVLIPWGAVNDGPPSGGAPALLAQWLFDSPGTQTDASGNGWTLFDAGAGASKTTALPLPVSAAWSMMFWVQAGWTDAGFGGFVASGVGAANLDVRATYDDATPWGVLGWPWNGTLGVPFPSGWVHFAAVFNPVDPVHYRLYVNGVQAAGSFSTASDGGAQPQVVGDAGFISDVRVYAGAHTPATLAPIISGGP